MYITNEEFDTYITRINRRFENLTENIQSLNSKVDSLTVQMQRVAEALDLQVPYTEDEAERPR